MNSVLAIILTLVVGLFIGLGSYISFKIKNKKKMLMFANSLAITVLIILSANNLFPEAIKLLNTRFTCYQSIYMIVLMVMFGIVLLRFIDLFIPDHGKGSLKNIVAMTSIALIIHNIIEGMGLYSSFLVAISLGLLFSIGIAAHNFALGLSLSTQMYHSTKNKRTTILLMGILSVSTLLGALLMFNFGNVLNDKIVLGMILGITTGMIIYIVFFELLKQVLKTFDKKISLLGIIAGILIMLIGSLV